MKSQSSPKTQVSFHKVILIKIARNEEFKCCESLTMKTYYCNIPKNKTIISSKQIKK